MGRGVAVPVIPEKSLPRRRPENVTLAKAGYQKRSATRKEGDHDDDC